MRHFLLRARPAVGTCPAVRLAALALMLSLSRVTVPGVTVAAQDTPLELGKPIARELKSRETHAYRIDLSAGQYAHLTVHQRSVDVALKLSDPRGSTLLEVDQSSAPHVPDVLSVVADAASIYRLEVAQADVSGTAGSYEITLDQLRPATASDRSLAAATMAFSKGRAIHKQSTAESRQNAIPHYTEALSLWRAAGDASGEASALYELGDLYSELADWKKTLEHYSLALPLFQAVKNQYDEAQTYTSLGTTYYYLGNNAKALEHYQQGLKITKAIGDLRGEADAIYSIGVLHNTTGEVRKALGYYEQALSLKQAAGDKRGESAALHSLGAAYRNLGEKQKALGYYTQALQLRRAMGDRRGESTSLNSLGVLYEELGDKQKALDYFLQSLPIRRLEGNRSGEASTTHNIGVLYQSLGDDLRALEHFKAALALREALGERRSEGPALSSLGSAYSNLGEKEKAIEYYNRALASSRAVGDRQREAITLNNLGNTYRTMGLSQQALDSFLQAVALNRTLGNPLREGQALYGAGMVHADRGDWQKAMEAFTPSLSLSDASSSLRGQASSLYGLARVERGRGHFAQALQRAQQALTLIESLRAKVDFQELRASYHGMVQSYYEFTVDLLMQEHLQDPSKRHDAAALAVSERARARTLLETLAEASADIRQGVDPAMLEGERALQQQITTAADNLARLLSGKHTTDDVAAARKEIEDLTTQYQGVQARIRATSPRYAALTQPEPLSLTEIQQHVVDSETVLLEYALGRERSYLWAVTHTGMKSYALPNRTTIEDAARRAYELLTARNRRIKFETADEKRARVTRADADYVKSGADLSRMLLGPVAQDLARKRLLIVGDGALQYLPFAALPEPQINTGGSRSTRAADSYVPLAVNHEVVNLPSASTLAVMRRELAQRQPAPSFVAILADPVFQLDDERLARVDKAARATNVLVGRQERDNATPAAESELMRSAREADSSEEAMAYMPRLPFTRREAHAIASLLPPAQQKLALDFTASRATAMSPELAQYRFVHFATHGLLNSRHPERSGIVLSLVDERGETQDGFLRAHEIYNLKLPAEMVVLSGCRTGLGKEVRGEGVIGLTRAFMYAGAARVLVSLWDVHDEATAALMSRLYKDLLAQKAQRPAAALRAAQVAMWKEKRWQAPYYWAAFTLQGEPR